MRKRWLLVFILIYAIGITGVLVTACAYKGNVTIETRDSFRFISPDLEPKMCVKKETDIHKHNEGKD